MQRENNTGNHRMPHCTCVCVHVCTHLCMCLYVTMYVDSMSEKFLNGMPPLWYLKTAARFSQMKAGKGQGEQDCLPGRWDGVSADTRA